MTTVECRIPIHEKFSPLLEPHTWKIALSGRSTMKCLALGTKVIMADGTLRAVEDVRVGDAVLGPDSRARHVLSVSRGHGPRLPWICEPPHRRHALCFSKRVHHLNIL